MEKIGIENLKEVVEFGMELSLGLHKAKIDDGKITLGDLPHFMAAIALLPKAVMGIDQVPAEAADLDLEELEELKNLVLAKLASFEGIEQKWLDIVNASLQVVQGLLKLYKA
jgi:hypothetical protein